MAKITVKDNKNNPIGWCYDLGTMIQAFHFKAGFVGRYIKSSDLTFDKQGKIYCYGDGTQSLIREANR